MARTVDSLPCGAKVRFGSYCVGNEPPHSIRWIKVNSNDTTLFAEWIEDFRSFDAGEPESIHGYRKQYGNNRYALSNIDQFLNSSRADWFHPQHSADTPPGAELTFDGTPYWDHPGFLSYFREEERNAVLPTDIVVNIPLCDRENGDREVITRKVFLPSRTNIFGSSEEHADEGEYWEIFRNGLSVATKPTQEAVDHTSLSGARAPKSAENNWFWWVRSIYEADSYFLGYVDPAGGIYNASPFHGFIGIRPALRVAPETPVSDAPDGEGYYTVII